MSFREPLLKKSLTIPRDYWDRLTEIAKILDRSVSWVIRDFIKDGIERFEENRRRSK